MSKDTALEFVITQYPPTRDGRYGQISGVAVAFDSDIIWVASFEDLSIGEKKKLNRGGGPVPLLQVRRIHATTTRESNPDRPRLSVRNALRKW